MLNATDILPFCEAAPARAEFGCIVADPPWMVKAGPGAGGYIRDGDDRGKPKHSARRLSPRDT